MTLSVTIPTFNCARKLKRCLESVKWADEIVVVDMGSVDNTLDVARKYDARIYNRIPKDSNFDKNRKFGMEKAKSDWILKIDSDEMLSQVLQKEIKTFLRSPDDKNFGGYNFYNRLFWFGEQIKHGCVKPKSHELRLVRNGSWHYNPYRYHQLLTVSGKVGFFRGYYDHYNYGSVNDFVAKTNKYTDLDSEVLAPEIEANFWNIVLPIGTFVRLFIWQRGFMDGSIGFVSSFLFAMYNAILRIKLWERQNMI